MNNQDGNDFEVLAQRYIAVWNQTDPAARTQQIAELWAEDAQYIDPMAIARGRESIDATISAVQQQFPGMSFELIGGVDAHHDQARFTWGLGPAEREALIVGFDVAVRDERGQLSMVLGFLDRVPA